MRTVRPGAPSLADLTPYDPKYLPARVYLNANESPYGLPEPVIGELVDALSGQMLHRYPDPLAKGLRARVAEIHGVDEDNVLLGNGGDELLFDIMLAYGGKGRKLLTAPPSFSSYELDACLTATTLVEIPRVERLFSGDGREGCIAEGVGIDVELGVDEDAILNRVRQGDIDVVMLASPNNPTGDVLGKEFVVALLDSSDAVVLIDQAYVEFADSSFDMTPLLKRHENLGILRTFSKAYALAGIRLGYLLASTQVISELCKVRQPYSVDTFSMLAGKSVLAYQDVFSRRVEESIAERKRVARALRGISGVTVYASEANYLLMKVAGAQQIWQRLYDEQGILLRDFSSAPYLKDCLRVSIGAPKENDEFLETFKEMVDEAS